MIFVGDMFYDDVIGRQVIQLVKHFVTSSNSGEKIVLVGDPGATFVFLLLLANVINLVAFTWAAELYS